MEELKGKQNNNNHNKKITPLRKYREGQEDVVTMCQQRAEFSDHIDRIIIITEQLCSSQRCQSVSIRPVLFKL